MRRHPVNVSRRPTLMCLAALVLAGTLGVAAQQPGPVGSIVGCLSNAAAQGLPGATVVANGAGVRQTTVTGRDGCYELKDLPLASYRVTARLGGFDNVTRDRVLVMSSTATRLDLTTRPSSICECVREGGLTLADQWEYADAVLHVRLLDPEPEASRPEGYYRHRARVLQAVKPASGRRPTSTFILQNQRSGSPDPYDVGQELVAFLKASGSDTFRIANDNPGLAQRGEDPSSVFLVQDGRIQRQPRDMFGHIGKPIEALLAELRTLSRRR
jgi:carboxypeptidase family protein